MAQSGDYLVDQPLDAFIRSKKTGRGRGGRGRGGRGGRTRGGGGGGGGGYTGGGRGVGRGFRRSSSGGNFRQGRVRNINFSLSVSHLMFLKCSLR